jgi:glycine/D-amino acid oxidase-like deaminating enzyme
VLVVGAGVTGLLTAVECALAGHRVTVLERGAVPDPAATSHDQHRALRTLAVGNPGRSRELAGAERRWRELAAVLGGGFYRRVGVVTAWPREQVAEVLACARAAGLPVTADAELPPVGAPEGTVAVREEAAGVLLAEQVLRSAAAWLAGHPAVELRPGCEVAAVSADDGRVRLRGGEVVHGDLVLVAAGPWTRELAGHPVVLYRQTMLYLRPPAALAARWRGAPAAGGLGIDGRGWALPPGGGALLKISSDAVCRAVPGTGGAAEEDQEPWALRLAGSGVLPDIEAYEVVGARACHYAADARDGGAHLARIGPRLWSRPACGGTGFAEAPLVARRITEAAREAAA